MLWFLIRRCLLLLPNAVGVVLLTFLLLHIVPGDPVEVLLGDYALAADREALTQALGLHLPLWQQLQHFFIGVLNVNLGASYFDKLPVTQLLALHLPATLKLGAAALLFALAVAFPLGVAGAAYRGKWPDKLVQIYSIMAFSVPPFWFGPVMIIVFALWLKILPVSGDDTALSIVLPAITLGLGMSAFLAKLIRNAMVEALTQDFIRTARAKGVPTRTLFWRHALRNALLPVLTVVFLQAGGLLTGAIITEAIFGWPGVGSLMMEALSRRDYPVVQGCVLFIAFTYMFMTLVADITCAAADPRIRYGMKG